MALALAFFSLFQVEDEGTLQDEIENLVAALASDDPLVRDRARARLIDIDEPSLPELKKGARSADPELRARCEDLVKKLEFEPGARAMLDAASVNVRLLQDPETGKRYEELLAGGKLEEILKEDYLWILYVFEGLLSDRREIAMRSIRLLHEILQRRKVEGLGPYTELVFSSRLKNGQSAAVRVDEYGFWSRWWYQRSSQDLVASWAGDAKRP